MYSINNIARGRGGGGYGACLQTYQPLKYKKNVFLPMGPINMLFSNKLPIPPTATLLLPPVVTKDQPIYPWSMPSRWKFSALVTRQPIVEHTLAVFRYVKQTRRGLGPSRVCTRFLGTAARRGLQVHVVVLGGLWQICMACSPEGLRTMERGTRQMI